MIDYETFKDIVSYLDDNNTDELRKYLEIEKNKYYLHNARKYLMNYLRRDKKEKHDPFCGYLDDKKILLFNGISIYILNSDEILTRERIQKIKLQNSHYVEENINLAQNGLNKFEKETISPVGFIKTDMLWNGRYIIRNNDYTVEHKFVKDNFDYAKAFLGGDVNYSLCNGYPVCLANSEKGKGLILGLK